MRAKGLRVNTGKTKVLISKPGAGPWRRLGRWPCTVCGRGVGANSIQCTQCALWIHARCSGIARGLMGRGGDYVCPVCDGSRRVVEVPDTIVLAGETLECVREFSYLGDVIGADGGAVSSSVARVWSGWRSFRSLQPLS